MLYSPIDTDPWAAPPRLASEARKIVSSVPIIEIQNSLDSALIARRSASTGSVSGLMPA